MRLLPLVPVALLAACSAAPSAPAPARFAPPTEAAPPPLALPPAEAPPPSAEAQGGYPQIEYRSQRSDRRDLGVGQVLMQGYFGATLVTSYEQGGFVEEPDINQTPVIGGGGQWVLAGDRVDIGLELGIAFNFEVGGGAFVSGGGGAVIAVDVDLYVVDLYGGLFASTFLGNRWRLYGAAGPLMQFSGVTQESEGEQLDENGFGLGYYVRGGVEYALPSNLLIGVGARWADSTIDFSGDIEDLDLQTTQLFVSVTTGL